MVQVHKFLDKNFDMVRQDILDLFIQSKNKVRHTHTHTPAVLSPAPSVILHHVPQMVSSLFLKHLESLSQQRSNVRRTSTARRYQANTVSAKFQSSLQELVEKMERSARTSSYFILKAVKIRRQKSELFKKNHALFLKVKKQ